MHPDRGIDRVFRRKLKQLTDDLDGNRRSEQLEAIPKLASEYGRSIELVAPFDPSGDYVCYQYAFGIERLPPLLALIRKRDPRLQVDKYFVAFLVANHLSQLSTDDATTGSIVIYEHNSVIQHAGLLADGRVTSKWGEAHLWRHALFDVPESYGDLIKVYAPIHPRDVHTAFVEYAKKRRDSNFIDQIILEGGASG